MNVLDLLTKPWVATCRETRDHLSDYLDGDLDTRTRTRTRIRRHLARCTHCQALLESLTRTVDQLRSLGSIDRGPELATIRAVVDRIEREGRPSA